MELLRAAVDGGASMVQMRDRLPVDMPSTGFATGDLSDVPNEARPYVQEMVAASTETIVLGAAALGASVAVRGALVLVHGGGDPALAASTVTALVGVTEGPVGLHLPEAPANSKPDDHRPAGDSIVVSRSIHSLNAAVQAERDGADMLVLGTVFSSASHPGGPTIGLEGVRAVCAAVEIPVIGIGGITAQNAGDVIRAGACGVAVISAIFDAPDPRAAAAELRAEIDAAWRERGT